MKTNKLGLICPPFIGPYLGENELPVVFHHKLSEEVDELAFPHLAGQKRELEVALDSAH